MGNRVFEKFGSTNRSDSDGDIKIKMHLQKISQN